MSLGRTDEPLHFVLFPVAGGSDISVSLVSVWNRSSLTCRSPAPAVLAALPLSSPACSQGEERHPASAQQHTTQQLHYTTYLGQALSNTLQYDPHSQLLYTTGSLQLITFDC